MSLGEYPQNSAKSTACPQNNEKYIATIRRYLIRGVSKRAGYTSNNSNVNDTIFNGNFSMDKGNYNSLTILTLPTEIISRILFHTLSLYGKLLDILHFITTCKHAYSCYHYLLYTIKPLTILSTRKMTIAWKKVVFDNQLCSQVKVLNVNLDNYYTFKDINQLCGLSILTITSKSLRNVELVLSKVSLRLELLQILLTKQNWPLRRSNQQRWPLRRRVNHNITAMLLETFAFSTEPLIGGMYLYSPRIHSIVLKRTKLVSQFVREIIDANKKTLKLIVLERVDFSLVYSCGVFPALELLVLDIFSCPSMDKWYEPFTNKNKHFPLIVVHDRRTGYKYTRKLPEEPWKMSKSHPEIMRKVIDRSARENEAIE